MEHPYLIHELNTSYNSRFIAPNAAAMASQEYVKLAQSLPPRLLRFFARFPPPAASLTNRVSSSVTTLLNTSLSDPNASQEENTVSDAPPLPYPNPFQSHKHPASGKWHDPVYSLRRQADLVKLARANGVEELLPYTVKGTEERIARRREQGLRVKGTGVGQKPKGKLWERTMKGRLEKRRQAMLEMPQMVQQWKQVGFALIDPWCELGANDVYSWAMDVAGRNGQDDRITLQEYLILCYRLGYTTGEVPMKT
jgi:large subunit ribosomal protein L25